MNEPLAVVPLNPAPASSGMAALYELVYDDPNLIGRKYIWSLSAVHYVGSVTITAELSDKTVVVATGDNERVAMRAILAKVRERLGDLLGNPSSLSGVGLRWLQQREGLRLEVYDDIGGYPTIGYGHRITRDEDVSGKILLPSGPVKWSRGLTHAQAQELLAEDADWAETAVTNAVRVALSVCQYDALVSFTFNVGATAFRRSTLLARLNNADYEEVPAQLMRWVYVRGRKRHGLINRRKSEVAQWSGGLPPESSDDFR